LLGPRDRLLFVTFEVGLGGMVRKTPLLSLGRVQSCTRLGKFVDKIECHPEESQLFEDEFLVQGNKEEKTDVITAVNHGMTLSIFLVPLAYSILTGLDVMLQRKSRNPVASKLLVSDAADSTQHAQIEFVLVQAEAANNQFIPLVTGNHTALHLFGLCQITQAERIPS
jgi:hypothetical protein